MKSVFFISVAVVVLAKTGTFASPALRPETRETLPAPISLVEEELEPDEFFFQQIAKEVLLLQPEEEEVLGRESRHGSRWQETTGYLSGDRTTLDDAQPDTIRYDDGVVFGYYPARNLWSCVRFSVPNTFELRSIYFVCNNPNNSAAVCSLFVCSSDSGQLGTQLSAFRVPGAVQHLGSFTIPTWNDVNLPAPVQIDSAQNFFVILGPAPGGTQAEGWHVLLDGSTGGDRSMMSSTGSMGTYNPTSSDWLIRAGGQVIRIPRPPTNLVGSYNAGNVVLTWTDPTQDTQGNPLTIDSVQVWLGTAGIGTLLGSVGAGVQTFTHPNAPIGVQTYSVRPRHGSFFGAPTSTQVTVGTPGYINDFELDNGNWVPDPLTGGWEWGVPTYTSGPTAHSGTKVWGTVLNGTYPNNACFRLTLVPNMTVNSPDARVEFWRWWNTETHFDGVNFKVSTDQGATWTLVQPVGNYPDTASTTNVCIPGELCWAGHTGGTWTQIVLPIGQFLGQMPMFRFSFGSDGSVVYPGFYFDDMMIWGLGPPLPDTSQVEGTVILDGLGGIVTDAIIESDGPGSPQTHPLSDGSYTLNGVCVGERILHASLMGYHPDTVTVVVPVSGLAGQNFTLRRLNPPAPTGLIGTINDTLGLVVLDWDDSPDLQVDVYQIYRRLRSEPGWTLRRVVNGRVNSLGTDTVITAGIYEFCVTAVDTNVIPPESESGLSNVVQVMFGAVPPHSLTADTAFDDRIRLSWLDPETLVAVLQRSPGLDSVFGPPSEKARLSHRQGHTTLDDVLRYVIYRNGLCLDSVDTPVIVYDDIVGSACEGVSYTYRVTARHDNGEESPPSDTISARCGMPPAAPPGISLARVAGGQMQIQWVVPAVNMDSTPCIDLRGFKVYRDGAALVTLPASQLDYVDTDLDTTTMYTWSVRAFDEVPLESPAVSASGVAGNPSYISGFDVNHGGWVADPAAGGWSWGTPTNPSAPLAHSPPNYWGTGLAANYNSNACCRADLAAGLVVHDTAAQAEFWFRYDTENEIDGCNFKLSTDNGGTWAVLLPSQGIYTVPNMNIGNTCIGGQPAWSGHGQTDWQYAVIPIGQYIGQTPVFRFEFGSGPTSTGHPGFFFDDMIIWGLRPPTSVRGIVRSHETSLPVDGVRIWAEGVSDTVQTDSVGCYVLPLEAGAYELTYHHAHYCDTTHSDVIVLAGYQTTHDAALLRPRGSLSVDSLAMVTQVGMMLQDSFVIRNMGGECVLDYWVADTSAWLSTYPSGGHIAPEESVAVRVRATVTGLIIGDHSTDLVVWYNSTGAPQTVHVDLRIVNSADDMSAAPTEFAYYQNSPNPFNGATTLRFAVAQTSRVEITIFNLLGQQVKRPVSDVFGPGLYGISVDAGELPSGLYLARMTAGSFSQFRKMMVVR